MKAKIEKLKNGLRIVTVPIKNNPTVTVMVLVGTGSDYETKELNGISHFLEHMCFKGTKKRPTSLHIAKELESMGADNNAFTSQEYTGYYAKGRVEDFKKLLDVVSDIYMNPLLPETELEKERGVIIDEINMYADLPYSIVSQRFERLLYGEQPAGRPILGARENILRFKREDFLSYRQKQYVANNTVVIVSGDVSHKGASREVRSCFAEIPQSKPAAKPRVVEKQNAPAIDLFYKKTDQTHVVCGVRSAGLLHRDTPVIEVLAAVLGRGMSSRLFQKIREEMGLGYYVGSAQRSFTDHGALISFTGINPRRTEEVIVAILEEMKKIRDELVPSPELRKTKNYMIGGLKLGFETTDSVADYFGFQVLLREKVKTPEETIKEIRAVSAEDIRRVARKLFIDKHLNLAVLGPHKPEFGKKLKKILTLK